MEVLWGDGNAVRGMLSVEGNHLSQAESSLSAEGGAKNGLFKGY